MKCLQRLCLLWSVLALFGSRMFVRAEAPPRPNILFALADDWSYGHAGIYGCKWVKTPAVDQLAQQGLLFTHAYTPNAKCAPSRSCILTGRNSWQLKAAANHWCYFPLEFKTYAEALGENGYFVGMTGKGWAPGIATNANGSARNMVGKPFDKRTLKPPTTKISPNDYAANFADFLDAAPKGKPWSFWFGCREPHREYELGSGVAKGGKKISDIDHVPMCWPDNEAVRSDMLDYAFAVENFDRHLGRMLAELEKRGLLDNTIIVVTSDNGMPFPHDKGNAYFNSNHLPLAIMWKNGIVKPGRRVDDYISFIDFAPTFMNLAGVSWDKSGMATATGHNFAEIFAAEKSGRVIPERDHVLIGRERNDVGRPNDEGYPIRGLVKDDMLYLHNFEPTRWPGGNPETGYLDTDGSPTKTAVLNTRFNPALKFFWEICYDKRPSDELYNLQSDPDCITNLAATASFVTLQNQLYTELKQQGDPRMSDAGHIFDEYPDASPAHNFFNRWARGEKVKTGWVNDSDFQPLP